MFHTDGFPVAVMLNKIDKDDMEKRDIILNPEIKDFFLLKNMNSVRYLTNREC